MKITTRIATATLTTATALTLAACGSNYPATVQGVTIDRDGDKTCAYDNEQGGTIIDCYDGPLSDVSMETWLVNILKDHQDNINHTTPKGVKHAN